MAFDSFYGIIRYVISIKLPTLAYLLSHVQFFFFLSSLSPPATIFPAEKFIFA